MARHHGSNPSSGENSTPYTHFDANRVRREAHEHNAVNEAHESKHEADLAKLDRGEGHEKGGR